MRRFKKTTRRKPVLNDGKIDIVLGGGGIKGYAHVGFLRAIEERRVAVGDVTGISIGSLVAAFYTNGYSPEQIDKILSGVLKKLDSKMLARALRALGSPRKLIKGGTDLSGLFEQLCTEYKLVPNPRLKIIAYNVRTGKPVLFQGTGYHLPSALTASCCVPGLMRPVWYAHADEIGEQHGNQPLIDGGIYHPHPTEFCGRRAIVSRLGHARRLPREQIQAEDMAYHLLEMVASVVSDWLFTRNSPDDLVILTGLPCVASLNFHPSDQICRYMIEHGYKKSAEALDLHIARGFIPLDTLDPGAAAQKIVAPRAQ